MLYLRRVRFELNFILKKIVEIGIKICLIYKNFSETYVFDLFIRSHVFFFKLKYACESWWPVRENLKTAYISKNIRINLLQKIKNLYYKTFCL